MAVTRLACLDGGVDGPTRLRGVRALVSFNKIPLALALEIDACTVALRASSKALYLLELKRLIFNVASNPSLVAP